MNYLARKHVGRATGRVRDGRPPRRGEVFALCDGCRWPFPLPRAGGNCRLVCGDCRRAEAAAFQAMLARLASLRHEVRAGCLAQPPGFEQRIRLYRARAAAGRPLFDGGPRS